MDKSKHSGVRIVDFDMYISCLALAVLICITVSGVFMRYLANRPFYWLEEVQLWCFVWAVFLGAGYVARKNGHIAIDAIITLFPAALRRAAAVLSNLVAVAVPSFLCYYSFLHVMQMYTRNRLTNILGIPFFLIYLVVPVACLIIVLSGMRGIVFPSAVEPAQEEESA